MQCPECGGAANKLSWREGTRGDQAGAINANLNAARGHPAGLIVTAGAYAAKALLSAAYRCTKCRHEWREWL